MSYWAGALRLCQGLACPEHLGLGLGAVVYEPCAIEDEDGHEYTGRRRKGWGRFAFHSPARLPVVFKYTGPAELGVRLLGFTEDRAHRLAPRRSGGLADAAVLFGLLVDSDSIERRSPEHRLFKPTYPPTIEDSYGLVRSVLEPTVALDSGGGVPAVYLFDSPVSVEGQAERLRRLARRFTSPFKAAADAAGWAFDSPPAATSWLRLPGSTTAYEGHTVTVLADDGPRYSLADIERFCEPWPDYSSDHYGSGWGGSEMRWLDGKPIPGPTTPEQPVRRDLTYPRPKRRRR